MLLVQKRCVLFAWWILRETYKVTTARFDASVFFAAAEQPVARVAATCDAWPDAAEMPS